MPPRTVTCAEFAREMGVSRQRIHALLASGRLPRNEDGSVPLVLARRAYAALAIRVEDGEVRGGGRHTQTEKSARAPAAAPPAVAQKIPSRAPAPPSPPAVDPPLKSAVAGGDEHEVILSAKARAEVAAAALAELKLEKLRGTLVDRRKSERLVEGAMIAIRDRILGVPARVAARLSGADTKTIERTLKTELTKALEAAVVDLG